MSNRPSILDALSDEERALLLGRALRRSLVAHELLVLAGDRRPRVHLLERGVVKLTARTSEGRDTILGLALPGDVVGDLAALDELPQPLDAVTATPCDVLGIDAGDFVAVLESNPRAAAAMVRSLAARCRWMCETTLERTASEVPGRLAGRLLDLADLL
ncbi:MAG: Crp/Fnr family transcriptional regulator, partial [Actinomycetota bacterium]